MREGAPRPCDAIDAFLSDLELAGRSRATLKPYRSYLKPLLAYESLAAIDAAAVRQLILDRLRVNQRTARTLHGILSSFFTYCADRQWCDNPLAAVPRPALKVPQHRYLSTAEIARVYTVACDLGETYQIIVRLLLLGLRARELLGLQWSDLRGEELHVRVTKGGRPRRVWLDADTRALLCGGDGPIVPMSYASLYDRLQRLSRLSGVAFTAHTWRRTWASHAFLNGMNISSVQRLGGWANATMPAYYARSALDEAALRDAQRMNLTGRLLDEGG